MTPKVLKIIFFSCICFLCISTSYGQLDDPKSSGKSNVPVINSPKKSDFIDPRATNEEKNDSALAKILKNIQEEENRKNLQTKGIITEEQTRKRLFEEEKASLSKNLKIIDQYLGGFSSTSKSVTIVCRDFQYPDGDTVTIIVNGKPVIHNIILTRAYQQFTLPLEMGLNEISFKALNQGSSGPNTAAFIVFDENAMELSSNEWELATGAKATLTIARIE